MIDPRVSSVLLAMTFAAACSRGADRGAGPSAVVAPLDAKGDPAAASAPAAPAPAPSPPGDTAPVAVMTTPGHDPVRVLLEVARTDEERRRGLMYRQNLAPDAGMLFLFENDAVQTFWMKNTLIPLDMIFIRKDGTVAGVVENAEPKTLTGRSVGKQSRQVLEVNGGFAKAHGIGTGTRVSYEHVDMTGYDK